MTETADKSGVTVTVPRKADGFLSRSIGDETIIVPVRGGVGDLDAIFTLNPVGATIWNLIDGATPLDRLAAAVVGRVRGHARSRARRRRRASYRRWRNGLLAGPPAPGSRRDERRRAEATAS